MTTYTWSSSSGTSSWGDGDNWTNAGNNTTGMAPTDLDTAVINAPGAVVTIDAGVVAAAYILDTGGATLDLDGGSLTTEHLATFNGNVEQSAGTYTLGGMGAVFNEGLSQTGGLVDVVAGVLTVNDGSQLAGTFAGAGVLDFNGGSSYLNTGFTCRLSSIEVTNGARLGLNEDFGYTHNLSVINSVLDVFGHTLTVYSSATLSGVVGNGTIQDVGTLTLGSTGASDTLDDGLIVAVTGTLLQVQNISLGVSDSGARINVGKTGHYSINGNWNVTDGSSVGSISNVGVFAKTGGGKLSQVDVSLKSSGTLGANIGELQLDGLYNQISGTVSGAGTLGIGGSGQTTIAPKLALSVANVHQSSGVLVFNAAQAYAGNWNMSGGVLDLNARAAVLTLNGHASFDFGTLTGFGGTLVLNGPAELGNVTIGGPDKLAVNGTLTQTGTIQFGQSSNPTAVIAAKASWLIDADSSILGQFGLITNNGVLWDRNGSGSAVIQAELVSTGTLIADSTLQLEGDSALSGTLSGTGLLDLSAGGITLESGLAIKVAALDVSTTVVLGGNLADANVVSQFAGNIDSAGYTLALSGTASLDGGVLSGGGTLAASGTTTVGGYDVTGAATLLISGTADQSGNLTVADGSGAGTLSVAAGAAYNILDDFAIAGAGTVIVAGKLTESGTGTAVIAAGVRLASAGLLTANDRTVLLTGGGSLAGTLAGTGNVDLAGGSFALAAGLDATSATLEVSGGATASLLANQSYGGDFISIGATLALGADTFSLTGTAGLGNNTVLTGSGTLVASASATLAAVSVQGSATLLLHGVAQQLGVISVGNPDNTPSTASFSIGNGGSDTLAVNAGIQGDGTLTVGSGGALIAASNGLSQISTTITDQGTIAANHGTLQVTGTVTSTSTGSFSIGAAGLLEFTGQASITAATGVGFAGTGTLRIDDLHTFGATIENFATNDVIQIAGIAGASASGTYVNASHTDIVVSDSNGNSIVLAFSSAQTLSAIGFSTGPNGITTLTHH